MGWEDSIRPGVHARFYGRDYVEIEVGDDVERRPLGPPGVDPFRRGLSPNHKALALAEQYAADPARWSKRVSEWLDEMNRVGHCYNEQCSSIYVGGYWTEAIASMTRTSFNAGDEDVYARCLRWFLSEIALESIGLKDQPVDGTSWLPGCRCGDCKDYRRDQSRSYLVLGRQGSRRELRWNKQWNEIYYAGAAMVRDLVLSRQVPRLPVDDSYMPRLMSRMTVRHHERGYTIFCERLDPCYGFPWWAVVIKEGELVDSVSYRDLVDDHRRAKEWGDRSRTIPRRPDTSTIGDVLNTYWLDNESHKLDNESHRPEPKVPPRSLYQDVFRSRGEEPTEPEEPTDPEEPKPIVDLKPSDLFAPGRWGWFLDHAGEGVMDQLVDYCERVGGGDLRVLNEIRKEKGL